MEAVVAEAWWITEEKMVAVRQKAILDAEAKYKAEAKQGSRLPLKQKGWVESKWLACDHCVTRGFDCQVGNIYIFLFEFLLIVNR